MPGFADEDLLPSRNALAHPGRICKGAWAGRGEAGV